MKSFNTIFTWNFHDEKMKSHLVFSSWMLLWTLMMRQWDKKKLLWPRSKRSRGQKVVFNWDAEIENLIRDHSTNICGSLNFKRNFPAKSFSIGSKVNFDLLVYNDVFRYGLPQLLNLPGNLKNCTWSSKNHKCWSILFLKMLPISWMLITISVCDRLWEVL